MIPGYVFAVLAVLCLPVTVPAADELAPNCGFEVGFDGWTRWGKNANLITLDSALAHSGTNSVRIQQGHNALYFTHALNPEQAYELRFAYRLAGGNPSGRVSLSFSKKGGPLRSAGAEIFKFAPPAGTSAAEWVAFRKVFLPTPITVACQFAFAAGDGSTLWVDDVSLRVVPRPADLAQPTLPWEGLKRRTPNPLFQELLTKEPGHYTVTSWSHDLNPKDKNGFKSPELADATTWQKAALGIFKETGEAGMGYMDLPGGLDTKEPWRTAEFHREQFRKYGVRYDVFSEGSGTVAAALKNGAELLNAAAKDLGRKPSVSLVDPAYVEAQCTILRKLGAQLRGEPFVGYFYGRDEPSVHIPEGTPEHWGAYGRAMAKEVLDQYGFGRFAAPLPKEKSFLEDPNKPLRWLAYNRWMNDKFIASRSRLSQVLHEADPGARYSPANYWFMSGFQPYDLSRLAPFSDLMECDPYASSAERERGRGVFNHGFGAKFMSDLTGKPVRIVAQAFHYAGYDMTPDDLREWLSQSLRCGASAITYYEMDSPRWTDLPRWKMMLHLSAHHHPHEPRRAAPDRRHGGPLHPLHPHEPRRLHQRRSTLFGARAAGRTGRLLVPVRLRRPTRARRTQPHRLQSGLSAPGQIHDARGDKDHRGLCPCRRRAGLRRRRSLLLRSRRQGHFRRPRTHPGHQDPRAEAKLRQGARTRSFSSQHNGDCPPGAACGYSTSSSETRLPPAAPGRSRWPTRKPRFSAPIRTAHRRLSCTNSAKAVSLLLRRTPLPRR